MQMSHSCLKSLHSEIFSVETHRPTVVEQMNWSHDVLRFCAITKTLLSLDLSCCDNLEKNLVRDG